jgi:AraC-like DNA-binding protein
MKLRNNIIRLFITLFLILIWSAVVWLMLFPKPLAIFPGNNAFDISVYDDSEQNGKSKISAFSNSKGQVDFTFMLKHGNTFPYCGMSFFIVKSIYFDASRYDYIKLRMKAENTKRIQVHRIDFIPGLTILSNYNTYRHSVLDMPVDLKWNDYIIPFNSLVTPEWNYDTLKTDEKKIGPPDSRYFTGINFQSSDQNKFNKKITYSIQSIQLGKSPLIFIISTVLFAVIILIVNILLSIISINNYTLIFAKPLELKNYAEEEDARIKNYLGEHYMDPDISIERLNQDLGISIHKITKVVQKISGMPFKKYLNYLRIVEARRQLARTDRPITEIAMMLGYNNTTHFNRVFKQIEKISPTDFRKGSY